MVLFLKLLAAAVFGFFLNWLFMIRRFHRFRRYYGSLDYMNERESNIYACGHYIFSFFIFGMLIYFAVGSLTGDVDDRTKDYCMIALSVGGIISTLRYIYLDFIGIYIHRCTKKDDF